MSGKETIVIETVLEDLNRPVQPGDKVVPIKPLKEGEDEVYNSLYSILKAGESNPSEINKNKE